MFGSIVCGKLKPGREGNLAIRGTFSIEQAFRLVAGHYAIGRDDLNAILGILVGCGTVMVTVGLPGGFATDWALGRATKRTMGCAMAGALVAVSARGAAGVASLVFALASPGSIVTLMWSFFVSWSSSPLFAECNKVIQVTTCIALLSICWALGRWMGIATIVAAGVG